MTLDVDDDGIGTVYYVHDRSYVDDYGDSLHRVDAVDFYADRAKAQAEVDRLNTEHRRRYDEQIERTRQSREHRRVEHEALVAAGLRSGEFREPYPDPIYREQYSLGEVSVIL